MEGSVAYEANVTVLQVALHQVQQAYTRNGDLGHRALALIRRAPKEHPLVIAWLQAAMLTLLAQASSSSCLNPDACSGGGGGRGREWVRVPPA